MEAYNIFCLFCTLLASMPVLGSPELVIVTHCSIELVVYFSYGMVGYCPLLPLVGEKCIQMRIRDLILCRVANRIKGRIRIHISPSTYAWTTKKTITVYQSGN